MANKLKAITTKAKALYKSGKFKKWTDAIKAASKSIGSTQKKIDSFTVKVGDKFQVGDLQYLVTKTGIDKGIEYAMKWKWEKNYDIPNSKRMRYSNMAFDGVFNEKNKIGKIAGTKKKTASKAKSYHKDTKSHNVNIRVVSGLSKITGIPHKAKYYIDYKKNGVSYIDYFDKLPNGYYKGMDRVLYKSMLTDYGTTLVPIRNVKTGKPVKK